MPPPRANVDEIVVSGEKDAVALAVAQITVLLPALCGSSGWVFGVCINIWVVCFA